MKRKVVVGVAAAMLATGGLTACSDSGGGSGEVELGIIAPDESQATSLPWMFDGAQAAVNEINAAGGINGRTLKLNTCNGQMDPNVELRCARQAVQGNNVGMVGQMAANGAQVDAAFTSSKMANIGLNAISPADAKEESSFVLGPSVIGYMGFAPLLKRELGVTKIAVLNTDTSAYDTSLAAERAGAQQAGVDIVAEIRVPTNATDMSIYLAQAADAGAQALGINMTQTQVLATYKALASSGSPLRLVVDQTSVDNNLKEAGAAAEGSFGIASTPAGNLSEPSTAAYLAAMKKYFPDTKPAAGGLVPYEAVYLFAEAAKKIDGDITRESVWEAMHNFSGEFAWFDNLDFTKPGPLAEFPRIPALINYPTIVRNGVSVALPTLDPTVSA